MKRKKGNWIAIVIILVAVVASTWIGIGIGRGVESARAKQLLGTLSQDVARYQEFAKEVEAIEGLVSGQDKMIQTILSIRHNYVDP
ncbi:MAG: hypothetical protein J6R02_06285, partial [Alistipes sp.]|nr:hypothetical protein [Alistipes sp.]